MTLTTGPASHDPAVDFPELAPHARTTVRLHPRRGTPGPRDSHIGGPLWWPAGEPWPLCAEHRDVNGRQQGPYPLVAVAQLTAVDFPEIRFPEGTDLVQLLWCPEWHEQPHPEGWGQACRLVWRRAGDVIEALVAQPDPDAHWDRDLDMIPAACVLHPERITEYPWREELPAGLADRHAAWLEERGLVDDVSTVPGCKLGGSMSWGVTDMPETMECGECRASLELFLQFDTYEYELDGCDGRPPDRFRPLEERGLEPRSEEGRAAREPVGMTVGRGGHAGLFVCSADPRHPASFFTQ
ncbi:DUF1963 domain-containing protein [Streptomyces sp. ISL-22]|uniref:DUF1963 domain-containing protein n=1 Tax=unclassified Streptomyces TaxID=2593676 RepID=UPI001BE888DF|nr:MULTISPECIES: DUF1963 domain-containing protein [unclassified Streptomyces]MBT2420827.1 DUF1963 domain-containing protein [Streptomyces sp. ISL-24]MBT2434781.1 DUF1963 domain-containing protein [Streptomyces sp. ISL-22]